MSINVSNRFAVGMNEYARFTMKEIVDNFLVSNLFQPDHVEIIYTHYDRFVVGGVMPVKEAVSLGVVDEMRSEYALDDGDYDLAPKEALYVGKGNRKIEFSSDDPANPAKFYCNSAGAHRSYPTKKVTLADAEVMPMGDQLTSNERVINKLLVTSTQAGQRLEHDARTHACAPHGDLFLLRG
jgi:4-deoxy-L-threo-5-hexosulose-uronate ketol-isomerase